MFVDADLIATLLASAKRISDRARHDAPQTERIWASSSRTVADMQAAGFYRMMQPRRFGGYEVAFDVYSKVIRAVSAGDGSSVGH